MRILLLGASGRCGTWVSRLASKRGHAVTAIVRRETEYQSEAGARVERGDVLSPEFVRAVLPGHDCVISCLGLRRKCILPWGALLSPPDLVRRAMTVLSSEIRGTAHDIPVIWISAAGVGESRSQATLPVRKMIDTGNIRIAYADLQAAEEIMESSGIDHLAVRPVTLLNGPPRGRARPVRRYTFFSFIRRSEVARWMLDVAEDRSRFAGPFAILG